MIENFAVSGVLVALTVGIVECIKRIGLNKKYLPLFALICGIGFMFLGMKGFTIDAVLPGIAIGLSAVGLFSGAKATLGK